jgi:hypothetical protein
MFLIVGRRAIGQLRERVRSPWTITIGAGFSATNDVVAAYMQAEWRCDLAST